jgi:uncharacterized protein with NRDE domain
MCTVFFAYKAHEKYPLIFMGNRDEFYDRPSMPAHFWDDDSSILAGLDMQENGSWTGITKSGQFAVVTNYRDFSQHKENTLSRGHLVRDFLIYKPFPQKYCEIVSLKADQFNPFNLVVGDMKELSYFSNMDQQVHILPPGIYGLSNHLLNTPWPKVATGKMVLKSIIDKHDQINPESLFNILDDKTIPPDDLLPNTGIGLDMERPLSSTFIEIPSKNYGTRFQTVILVDDKMHVTFIERSRDAAGQWQQNIHEFNIDSNNK